LIVIVMYALVILGFGVSLVRSRAKTIRAVKVGFRSFLNLLPSILLVVGLVGFVVGLLPPRVIQQYVGPGTGLAGTLIAAVAGAITMIPSLVAFPLAGSLLDIGATIGTVAAFITTLTMVGVVTAPLEVEQLGPRFALWRNGLSFILALFIATAIEVIL